ncbi:hypothetical protein O181_079538 [Austropuccinia psidii MF-1]|uniref:Integrase catalytic domain-containing protein n=1 Tax=Austropuccinia psidii MF-1 TaxID=1389203 RepID=A0A9Q3FGW0_9BASI|nr:hypothetical protein [Austropuccinia psidii MF-1]
MIQIQKPKSLWEIVHLDWVTSLPPGGDRSFNSCLVLVDRYSKTPMFLPCHKNETAMETAIMMCNRVISHTGLFKNILSYRDPKFTSELWTNLHKFCGKTIRSLAGKTPAILLKGWSLRLPHNPLKK